MSDSISIKLYVQSKISLRSRESCKQMCVPNTEPEFNIGSVHKGVLDSS